MAEGFKAYSDRIEELLVTASVEDLRDLVRMHLSAMRGFQYSIERLKNENDNLRKMLTEHDRTGTFYRYHKGAKS